ncbi:hypothetical protein [Thermosulfuriphilus sp.]
MRKCWILVFFLVSSLFFSSETWAERPKLRLLAPSPTRQNSDDNSDQKAESAGQFHPLKISKVKIPKPVSRRVLEAKLPQIIAEAQKRGIIVDKAKSNAITESLFSKDEGVVLRPYSTPPEINRNPIGYFRVWGFTEFWIIGPYSLKEQAEKNFLVLGPIGVAYQIRQGIKWDIDFKVYLEPIWQNLSKVFMIRLRTNTIKDDSVIVNDQLVRLTKIGDEEWAGLVTPNSEGLIHIIVEPGNYRYWLIYGVSCKRFE